MTRRARVVLVLVLVAAASVGCLPFHGAAADDDAADAMVEVLTDSNFHKMVKSKEMPWFVEFYAPWCGHCKHLAPEFETAAKLLDGKVKLGKVDATANPTVKAAQGVSGYPTLKFYRDGVVSLYSGPRTSDALVAFAERMTGPAVRLLGTLGAVREFGAKNQVSFIFAKPQEALNSEGQYLHEAFKDVAKELQANHAFGETRDAEFAAAVGSTAPFVVKYEEGETPVVYTGASVTSDLKAWVEANQFPVLTQISSSNFRALSYSGRFMAIAVVDPTQRAATKSYLGRLRTLARPDSPLDEVYRSRFNFCWLDGVRWKEFVAQFNIKPEQLPRIFVLDGERKIFYEDVEVDEEDEMETFLRDVVDGKVPVQREGIWGLPQRMWGQYMEYWPHSLFLTVAALLVLGYSCWPSARKPHDD